MYNCSKPLRIHPLATAVLVGVALAVLTSCSPLPDSQPTPSSNSGPTFDSNGGSTSVIAAEVTSDDDSSGDESEHADSLPTEPPLRSAETSEDLSDADAVASDSTAGMQPDNNQPDDSPIESANPPDKGQSDAEPVSEVAADAESSNLSAPEDRSDDESLEISAIEEQASASDSNAPLESPSYGAASDDTAPDDTVFESDAEAVVEDRAWQLVKNRGRLRVGLDPTIGYTYLRADPEHRTFEGFEWDILQALAQELNVEIEPVYVPWDNQLTALHGNSIDLVLGGRDELGIDDSRFSPTLPYYSSPQRIVVREDLSGEIQHLSDLFGQKVGTVADSAGAAVVEVFNRDRANALTLLSSPNPSQLFEQLRQLEVDAIVIDQPVAVAEAEQVESIAREEGDRIVDDEGRPTIPNESAVTDASSPEASQSEADSALGATAVTENESAVVLDPVVTSPSQSEEYVGVGTARAAETTIEDDSTRGENLAENATTEDARTRDAETEDTDTDVRLHIVGDPIFPTALVGIVRTEHTSIKQAIDEAIATLEQNGTITSILEKWEL
ncbi:MAG: transporter substrate-binding domain-containing protein [Cyanobacteria bacterium P01_E01_bin.34]